MAENFDVIRSYQRIFRPDRRIFQIDNHRLPVPGGVPLMWLGYAVVTLLLTIVLSARSEGLLILIGAASGAAGWVTGGRLGALLTAATAIVVAFIAGTVLSVLDWPLRLLVVPAMVATLLTQATPDGRPAHRYLASWIGVQLRPSRRSVGRTLPPAGSSSWVGCSLWVAWDERSPWLRHARVTDADMVEFSRPVTVRSPRWPRRSFIARPSTSNTPRRRRAVVVEAVALGSREPLEVRP